MTAAILFWPWEEDRTPPIVIISDLTTAIISVIVLILLTIRLYIASKISDL